MASQETTQKIEKGLSDRGQLDRGLSKVQEGVVVSNKGDKTIVVAVKTFKKHSQYGKYIQETNKYMAHDENNECNIGDKVTIKETRPLSRKKRWRLAKITERVA